MEGSGNNNPPTITPATAAAAETPSSPSAGEKNISPAMENQSESCDNGNADNNKKPVWGNRPSNGSVVSDPVLMGAAYWPALSESTKASPKLSNSGSSKNLSDSGSVPPQGTGIASSSPSLLVSSQLQSPVQSPMQSPMLSSVTSQKPTTTNANANHNPAINHGRPVRQRSMNRDGGGNAQANGGFSHQPSPVEGLNHHNSSLNPSSGGGYESSSRDNMQNPANREVGSWNGGGDHPQPRRRGNGGPQSRGDGSYQNYGGRHGDQDRGNHPKSFNGSAPVQPRVSPRGFVRTPPVSAPFVHPGAPAPLGPFVNPMAMGMPDMHMVYFPQVPFVPPVPAPMYFPAPDPQLKVKIVSQIDYYFSNENLVKDTYLRQNMDQNGWVSVALIAGFKKVKQLTDNIQLVLEAVQSSSVVEAQGDKIRRRGDWIRWIMPFPVSGSQSPTLSNAATLSDHIQSVTLDEDTGVSDEAFFGSSSRDLNSSSRVTKDGASSGGC